MVDPIALQHPEAGPPIRSGSRRRRLSWLAVALLASLWDGSMQAVEPGADPMPAGWGFYGVNAPWQEPDVTIDPESAIGRLANAQIYASDRKLVTSYRFPVPVGTYTIRLHYLQVSGGEVKNNACLSAVVNGRKIADKLEAYGLGKKQKTLPSGVAAKSVETQVESDHGQILVFFPQPERTNPLAISGLEILGTGVEIRVNCGAKAPYTDRDGHVWEPDADRVLRNTSGEVALGKRTMPRGEWVNLSDEFLARLAERGIAPLFFWGPANSGMPVCDRSGNTYVWLSGIGLWRYDLQAGLLTRVDAGKLTSVGRYYSVAVNPNGPGFICTGSNSFRLETSAIRSLDGCSIDGMASLTCDCPSVDWNGERSTIFLMIHERGQTMLSTDAGRTFAPLGDDGKNLLAVGALGGKVLVKWLNDGAIMRSIDLGATWSKCGEITRVKRYPLWGQCRIDRIGTSAFATSCDGLYRSQDQGASWHLIANSPVCIQSVVRGRSDAQVIGFTQSAAWESLDGGETWKKIRDKPGTDFRAEWAYDPAGDVLYVGTDAGLFRYER